MEKIKLSEIRAKFPMYADVPDDQLLIGLRKRFYSDIPPGQFYNRIDFDTQRSDPTEGMSGPQKFFAGVGKGMTDVARGVGQLVGLGPTRAEMDEIKRRDAALTNTGAGLAGNVLGSIAATAPVALIPGANTAAGAAAIGGATGFAAPVGTDDSRLMNAGLGTALGAATVMAPRAIAAGYKGGKALVEPFSAKGREAIAARTIAAFADDPAKIAAAQASAVPGVVPTTAEATRDVGMAQLTRALQNADPQFARNLQGRAFDNNAAMLEGLRGIAGDPAKRAAAVAARGNATRDLYQQATSAMYTVDDDLAQLLNRPAVRDAAERANRLALNDGLPAPFPKGIKPDEATVSGQALQYLKMGMDNLLADPKAGIAGAEARQVQNLRNGVVGWMEQQNPAFKQARQTYFQMSQPINQMDVGGRLLDKVVASMPNFQGTQQIMPGQFGNALRDTTQQSIVRTATGQRQLSGLADVLNPQQMGLLRGIEDQLGRSAGAMKAGMAPGSPTAQNLSSQNVLRQLIGPTGLPETWAESTLLQTLVKPLNLVYSNISEPKVAEVLGEALLDPQRAAQLVAKVQSSRLPNEAKSGLLEALTRYLPGSAVAASMSGQR